MRLRRHSILPGFGLTMGFTILYLSLFVLIPLSTLFWFSAGLGVRGFYEVVSAPRVVAAFELTFLCALAGAAVNAVMGFIVAWTLIRYRFPGHKLVDALIDLPFALPTAVSGIALTAVWAADGWLGGLLEKVGVKAVFTPLGIIIAMTFIGLPFVVRTLQPVIEDFEPEFEEAAASLGADRWQAFWRVIFPALLPALLTGFALAFARAIGEYGSIIFIAGNMPAKTEILALLIVIKLEQYDVPGATAIAASMLVASFVMLLIINLLQWWSARHLRARD